MDNINLQTKKFFLYARKSTDEPERQVLSIEAQLFELQEYAKKEGLNIVREFVESKCVKLEKTDTQNCFCGHPKLFLRTPKIVFADTEN